MPQLPVISKLMTATNDTKPSTLWTSWICSHRKEQMNGTILSQTFFKPLGPFFFKCFNFYLLFQIGYCCKKLNKLRLALFKSIISAVIQDWTRQDRELKSQQTFQKICWQLMLWSLIWEWQKILVVMHWSVNQKPRLISDYTLVVTYRSNTEKLFSLIWLKTSYHLHKWINQQYVLWCTKTDHG